MSENRNEPMSGWTPPAEAVEAAKWAHAAASNRFVQYDPDEAFAAALAAARGPLVAEVREEIAREIEALTPGLVSSRGSYHAARYHAARIARGAEGGVDRG